MNADPLSAGDPDTKGAVASFQTALSDDVSALRHNNSDLHQMTTRLRRGYSTLSVSEDKAIESCNTLKD